MSALGSLVVSLGLEYAQFTGGLDKSEQAALQASKRIQDTMDGLKSRLAATAGAIAGGLAAGFTIAAFTNIISGAIETGAALDDLAMQTGATVEALSGLAEIGKFNDMGPEKIGAAMNTLTRNLSGATEESKGAGKALQALGLDFDAFKQMRPEDQMQAVAKAMDQFEDGTGKSAVAMALYGKEGAKMLPFMKDLAGVGELQAKVTAEQAAAAAQLDDNWLKLTTTGGETAKEVAMGMVPAFDEAVRAATDVMSGTGGMREMLRGLVADGSIKQWTTDAIKGLSYVADAGQIAWRVLQSIGKGLGGLAAALVQALSGDFRSAWNTLKDSGKDMLDVFDGPTIGARFRESLDRVGASSESAGGAAKKAAIDFRNLGDGAKGAKGEVDKLASSGADLAASLLAQDSGLSGDFHKKWDSLSAAYRSNKISQDDLIDAQARLLEQQPAMKKAMEEATKVSNAAAEARRKEADGIRQWFEQQENIAAQSLAGVNDRISGLRDEAEALELAQEKNISLAEAVEQLALARLEEKQARFHEGSEGYLAVQKEIEARKELLSLMGSKTQRDNEHRGWTDMWQSVDRTAHDVFTNVFDGGSNVFKKLGQTLKASVLDVLYQMTVRKWMINIGTSVLGAGLGTAANAATGGSGGSMLGSMGTSMLGSAVGGASALGIGASYGATSLFANGLGATLSAGSSMIGAGSVMSGIGTIAGALGPIALGIAGVVALVKGLDDSGTPHTGAGAIYSAAGGLQAGAGIYSKSVLGMGSPDEYSAAMQSGVSSVAKGIAAALDSTAKSFGKTAGYEITTAFADDSSKDGAWGALKIKLDGQSVLDWADTQASKWAPKEFANGEEGAKQYAAALGAGMRTVLDGIGLPKWATTMLDAIGDGATVDQLAGAIDQINAAKAAFASFGQYMPVFANLADSAQSALVGASGGVQALAGNMASFVENFYTDAEKTSVATRMVTDELAMLGYAMPSSRDEYKAWVTAAIDAGEAGVQSAAGLLRLQGAVAAVLPATENAADGIQSLAGAIEREQQERATLDKMLQEQHGLWADLAAAQGDNATAAQRRYWIETAGMTAAEQAAYDYNQSIRDQITAANDAAAAVQRATSAMAGLGSTRFDLENQLYSLQGRDVDVAQRIRERDLIELTAGLDAESTAKITAAYDYNTSLREQIKVQEAANAAAQQAAQQAAQAANAAAQQAAQQAAQAASAAQSAADQIRSAWQSVTDSLFDEVRRIRGLLDADGQMSFAQAQADFAVTTAQARAGDQDAAKLLPGLSRAMLDLAASNASTLVELQLLRARTGNSLAETGDLLTGRYGLSLPQFADGGYYPGGLALVGERGPEIINFAQPAQVYTASQTRDLMGRGGGGDTELLAEVRQLRQQVVQLTQQIKGDNLTIKTNTGLSANVLLRSETANGLKVVGPTP